MWKVYSERRSKRVLTRLRPQIRAICRRFQVNPFCLEAILHEEMARMDLLDYVADLAVWLRLKEDSSTGLGQIFGYVGLEAANYGIQAGLITPQELGLPDRRLDGKDPEDVRRVWKKLNLNRRANLTLSCLNLVCCAREKAGKTDFGSLTDQELKLVLTRYNANVDHVTEYGLAVFETFQALQAAAGSKKAQARKKEGQT